MEAAYDLQRRLGHRLVEVAAGGRDRSADGYGTGLAVLEHHAARALVERRDARLEVGRERLFARDLLETSRELAHRLRPAGGRVGENEDVEAHLSEVFRKRHRRVHGGLARGDRHRRGVADYYRALHQRLTGLGVDDLGEFLERLDNLASALAARGGNHDVHLRIARGSLLENRLSCAEGPGDAVCPADGDGEERVDRADRSLERLGWGETVLEALDRHLDGPALHHLHRDVLPVCAGQGRDRVGNGVVAVRSERLDRVDAAQREGNHDLVAGHRLVVEDAFCDPAEEVACGDAVSDLRDLVEVPLPVAG